METLKILVFNWRCWLNPKMGGAEVFTREHIMRWAKKGHSVTLFTAEFPNCKGKEFLDGIRILRAGGSYSVYWKAKQYYKKHFSKERYDIIIDEINTRPFLTPKFVNKGEKIVALIHQLAREYWFYETFFILGYLGYYFLENRWLKNYVDIPTVTVSESTKKDLMDLGFEKVYMVSEGVNFKPLDKVSEKERHPVVVYVGRLKRAKRPDHAVEAFKILKTDNQEVELWIIGDGYLRKKMEKRACNGVKFFTKLSNESRRDLIKKAWVLVNPSVREGFGLNVVEANALGVPCVAYDVPGLRDSIQNGETGLLVDAGNVKALAEGIATILNDAEMRKRLNENALKYAEQFNWDRSAQEFLDIIQKIISL